jgi:hypothetical protein
MIRSPVICCLLQRRSFRKFCLLDVLNGFAEPCLFVRRIVVAVVVFINYLKENWAKGNLCDIGDEAPLDMWQSVVHLNIQTTQLVASSGGDLSCALRRTCLPSHSDLAAAAAAVNALAPVRGPHGTAPGARRKAGSQLATPEQLKGSQWTPGNSESSSAASGLHGWQRDPAHLRLQASFLAMVAALQVQTPQKHLPCLRGL